MDPLCSDHGGVFIGLPRARGDGPTDRSSSLNFVMASPRSRGWTLGESARRAWTEGFPALAGMDPAEEARLAGEVGLPRARGDGPRGRRRSPTPRRASPRSRGWTSGGSAQAPGRRGFPALAGMDPALAGDAQRPARLPRARGDGPRAVRPFAVRPGASPRSRGWTLICPTPSTARGGFPALAGMDPPCWAAETFGAGLPRARGDGPPGLGSIRSLAEASPRSRGWTLICPTPSTARGGFPALAGMDLSGRRRAGSTAGLPRARGDGPCSRIRRPPARRASPRSRGWTRLGRPVVGAAVGFPALAGMDPAPEPGPRRSARLPRARGDGPHCGRRWMRRWGASPRSRGWTRCKTC